MKFRKKPVVIDAEQFDGTEESIVKILAMVRGQANAAAIRAEQDCLFIPTMEGTMRADKGDWIIRGVQAEIYPCKPDIFEATYEKA